jgi:pimeloyl-ACP methyl ester carboxylesterase
MIILAMLLAALFFAYRIFPDHVARLLIAAGRRFARMRVRQVVVDGRAWAYLEGGRQGAAVILLVHGFGADKDSWLLYARALTRDYFVIAPDLPGFGDSTRDAELGYTALAQAGHLHGFIAALGLEEIHLAGISMGGFIAAHYAMKHPDQVSSLVLFDSAGIDTDGTSPLREAVDSGVNPLTVRTPQEFDAMVNLIMFRPPWIPRAFIHYFLGRSRPDAALHDRIFWGLVEEFEVGALNDRLPCIGMPTLIIWGREDQLFPVSIVDIMLESIPDSRSVILDNAGHAPTVECPWRTVRPHLEFLGALVGRGELAGESRWN